MKTTSKGTCTCWSGYVDTPLMVPRRPDCPVHGQSTPRPSEAKLAPKLVAAIAQDDDGPEPGTNEAKVGTWGELGWWHCGCPRPDRESSSRHASLRDRSECEPWLESCHRCGYTRPEQRPQEATPAKGKS